MLKGVANAFNIAIQQNRKDVEGNVEAVCKGLNILLFCSSFQIIFRYLMAINKSLIQSSSSIIAHGLVHAALKLATCSRFIPWSIFASLRNRRCSCLFHSIVFLRRPSPRWLSQQKLDQRSHDLLPPPCLATGSSRIVANHARPEICWN